MKINGGLLLFISLFAVIAISSVMLGGYDPITPTVPEAQAVMAVGPQAAGWIGYGMNWLVKLVIGGICTGFGVAAFNEARKAYKLWKRDAQAGRWQSGPNANWQRSQPVTQKFSKQDMMLLALSGRLPGLDTSRSAKAPLYSTSSMSNEEDELDIRL